MKYSEIRIFGRTELDSLPETRNDDEARTIEKEFLSEVFSLPPERIFFLKQTHKDQSHYIGQDAPAKNGLWYADGDAMYTDQNDMLLVIRTADCIPLFLKAAGISKTENRIKAVAGIVHAGWRGLKEGIVEKTMHEIQHTFFGETPAEWELSMGPAISGDVYQVDSETASWFSHKKKQIELTDKYLVDLYSEAKDRMLILGKKIPGTITGISGSLESCTYTGNDLFYSHRKGDVKRNLNTIILRNI